MFKDSLIPLPDVPILMRLILRPFARGTILAYELVLIRSQGERVYERSIGYLNGTDAADVRSVCPVIQLAEAR